MFVCSSWWAFMSIFAGIWRVMELDRGRELLGPGFAGCRGGAWTGRGFGRGAGLRDAAAVAAAQLASRRRRRHRPNHPWTETLSTHPLTLPYLFLLFIPTLFFCCFTFLFNRHYCFNLFQNFLCLSASFKQNTFNFFASYL